MRRPVPLEHLALLAIACSLSAVWLGLWVQWALGAWFGGPPLPAAWPAGLALAGLASALLTDQALGQRHVAPRAARLSLAALGGASVLLLVAWGFSFRLFDGAWWSGPRLFELAAPGVPLFLAALYAWLHGEQLGRSPVGNQALRSTFITGLAAFAPLLILNNLLPELSAARALGGLLLFFGLGLSGLALSSLRHLRQQQQSAGLASRALGREWLLTSSVVIGLVLGAGLLAANLVAAQTLQQMAGALGAVADSLLASAGVLLGPLVDGLARLLAPWLPALAGMVERFISLLVIAMDRLQSLVGLLAELLAGVMPGVIHHTGWRALLASPAFQASARWAGLLALLALAALVCWLAARRLWGLASTDADEQRESVLSSHLLLAQLRALLRRRPRRPRRPEAAYLALAGAPDDARLIIRRTYQAMLEWAQSLRLPRAAGQTPRAYAQMLAGAVPDAYDAIDLLTQAYVLARYAAETPSLEQARRAEGAMARLKALHS